MKSHKSIDTYFKELRKRAEKIIKERNVELPQNDEHDFLRLLHEVEVQNIELQLQNQQLRHVTGELENSRNEFADLYQSAPIAIISLNTEGIIKQFNATAARMFPDAKRFYVGMAFSELITPEDRSVYFSFLNEFALNRSSTYCKLRLVGEKGLPVHVQLHARAKHETNSNIQWHFALVDITELEKITNELESKVAERTAELEVRNRQYRELARRSLSAMENDRKVLAKEIHDGIAGSLAAIKMQLESRMPLPAQDLPSDLMPLEKVITHLAEAINETRRISKHLRTPTLDDFGLKPALEEYIRYFKEFYSEIEVPSEIEVVDKGLDADTQTVLFRVCQEALNNVGKHSTATEVRVKLIKDRGQIILEIMDNGCGFDLHKTLSDSKSFSGYGIRSMRERVELCGGKFHISSEPGQGTAINIEIPA